MTERDMASKKLLTSDPLHFRGLIPAIIAICLAANSPLALPVQALAVEESKQTAAAEVQSQVTLLIEQLGNENFRIRSNAMAALERIGLPAFEQLRRALEHPNIQVAISAEYLLLSQNVIWWLDTDSHEVRERLQDYSSLTPRDRHTRLGELALIGTDDALMSLCRIARFESDELISRAAALSLLKKIIEFDPERLASISKSILLAVDQTDRIATKWLASFANERMENQPIDLEVWRQYAVELTLEASQSQRGRGEQRLLVLQYYEWLAEWSNRYQSRLDLLDLLRPSLTLVDQSSFAVHEYGYWALSIDLPELVIEIATTHSAFFENDHGLSYMLAEAYRQMEQDQRADELAEQARQVPKSRSKLLGQLARGGAAEMESAQRSTQARRLRDRGHYDWAEAEYLEALTLESRDKSLIQVSLAELYWEGEQYEKAAEVLEAVASAEQADANLPGTLYDHSSLVAHYHWYRALHLSGEQQYDEAMDSFRRAIDANSTASVQNPDILISLYRNVATDEDRQYFQEHFDTMVRHYRSLVSAEEARLAHSNMGKFANAGADLAEYCNQLAWLLSNCETNVEEALYLSRRCLEYYPEVPAFLDTMARCAFAAGRLEEAVAFQQKAFNKSPHDRLMKAQLSQFESALAGRRDETPPRDDNGN